MDMSVVGCTAVRLTSQTGRPYWFRTCDIGGDIWAQGAHVVSFPKGEEISLYGHPPIRAAHALVGATYNQLDSWLLDGTNDAGLTGGLLALYEATSVPVAALDREGVMGQEVVTWMLATCASVDEVIRAAERIQILDVPVGEGRTVAATMHCMFTEPSGRCVILEAADPQAPGRLTVYEQNLGLMTNSPPYPRQLQNLSWYLASSPEWGWGHEAPPALTLNGMTVVPDPHAPHEAMSGALPASFAASDRFLRIAMMTHLNDEGRGFSDEAMLPLGAQIMETVMEPHNRGLYHYQRFDPKTGPEGGHESYTQYLVMYDVTQGIMYLRPYGSTGWTRTALGECPGARCTHPVDRRPMAGVVSGD